MLSSLSLGSIDNLEKLPINSLNSICDRVRQALLHVYLPRLCESCQPAFSEAFRKTQSTPLLLKALCDPCKINYVRDKRSVSRKKPKPEVPIRTTSANSVSTELTESTVGTEGDNVKYPAKKKQKVRNFPNNLTVKIKLISTTLNSKENQLIHTIVEPETSFSYQLPLTPPPTDDLIVGKVASSELDDVTILIDNGEDASDTFITSDATENRIPVPECGIYEYLSEKNVEWCRYCGVAGDTGTFWKLGPWGDRTLCHKHGCEFFGCGFARVTRTRLDLTEFYGEKRSERKHPIISEFCSICWERNLEEQEFLTCHGCPLSFHRTCFESSQHSNSVQGGSHSASSHTACVSGSGQNINHTVNTLHSAAPHSVQGFFFCAQKCHENFGNLLIRPQFPSKSQFPFYRQLLSLNPEDTISTAITENTASNVKLRINLKQNRHDKQIKQNLLLQEKKRRKYQRKQRQNENQSDRVMAFLPIKVDHSVHHHETIKTPQWTKKSLFERMEILKEKVSESQLSFEDLNDQFLLNRHARYEHVEKTTRLLKPGVLKELISGQ